jgi:hypothetical protein
MLMKLESSRQIFEKSQSCMKIRAVGAVLFHADGQTSGHDEANSRLTQFFKRDYKLLKITLL